MNPNIVPFLQIGGIIAVGYFLLIRPSQQARKQSEALQAAIKKGDDVITSGGIVGKVRDVKESLITIDSGTSTLVVQRHRIVQVGTQASAETR